MQLNMNLSFCENCSYIRNGTSGISPNWFEFETPFHRPFERTLFITCYSLVFVLCVTGMYNHIYEHM